MPHWLDASCVLLVSTTLAQTRVLASFKTVNFTDIHLPPTAAALIWDGRAVYFRSLSPRAPRAAQRCHRLSQ